MEIKSLFPDAVYTTLKKGTCIYDPEPINQPPYVYYLTSGIACVRATSADGTPRIYLIYNNKQLINHFPALTTPTLLGEGSALKVRISPLMALTDCKVYRIDTKSFLRCYYTNMRFNEEVSRQIEINFIKLMDHFIGTEQDNAVVRLCRMLLEFSRPAKNGLLQFDPRFTYQIMAEYIGTHPVTISRIIAKLLQSGCIKKDGRKILIKDLDALQAVMDSKEEISY